MACCTSFENLGKDQVIVRIANMSSKTLMLKGATYIRGEAIGGGWPSGINNEDQVTVKSEGFLTGVSGYVTYEIDGTNLTIAFSNPGIGSNKLNAGTNGKGVWDDMESKDYKPWAQVVQTHGGMKLHVALKCSSGSVNNSSVELFVSRE